MATFAFEKGDDFTIRLNGKVLGGVKRVVCKVENYCGEICEFLTDEPVYRKSYRRYKIELVMNSSGTLDFLQGQSFDSLDIFNKKRIVTYSDCFVASVTAEIKTGSHIEYTVKITADGRREL